MWNEIFPWIERYAGVSYDLSEEMNSVDKDMLFYDPHEWKIRINNCLDRMYDMFEVIDQFKNDIPDTLPNATDMKKMIGQLVLEWILYLVNYAKKTLGIQETDVSSMDDLLNQIQCITDLSELLTENSIDQLIDGKFEECDEDNDGMLIDTFGITKGDLSQMKFNADSIKEDYFAYLDES